MERKRRSVLSWSPKALRRLATELFLEQAAIAVLANAPDRLSSDQVADNLNGISSSKSVAELNEFVSRVRKQVAELRNKLGVRASRAQLLSLMGWLERNTKTGQACYMPAGMLSEFLSLYDQLDIPPHARISIDYFGIGRDYPGGFEIRLLEASLFEDMCALFNLCRESENRIPHDKSPGSSISKVVKKRHAALIDRKSVV